jgi:hypothetical protein
MQLFVSIPCIKYVYEIFKYTTEWKLGCENNCICMEIYMLFKSNLPKKIYFKQNENLRVYFTGSTVSLET